MQYEGRLRRDGLIGIGIMACVALVIAVVVVCGALGVKW
jgi:hypothetical protein